MCAYYCAQLSYAIQHRTVLIIFLLISRQITTAQMLYIGRKEIDALRQKQINYEIGKYLVATK